jgi:hypothetical protein
MLILFAPSNAILFLLFYHSIRQLRLVSRTYSTLGHVDIYRLEPLYALSVPGALTAIGLIVLAYLWSALSPAQSQQPAAIGLALTATGFTIAVVAFALPFWGAHRQLVFEKASALAEASSRFRATTIQLHRDLDRGRLREMDQLHKALASLEIEQNAIRKVSTWPSQLVAVRSLLAALLLPILIWAIQQALGRLIGP